MTDITLDKEFFDIVDTFVHLVNEHGQKVGGERAGFALTFAAARYSAFLVASNSADLDKMKTFRQEAKSHFMTNYEKALESNFSEYEENYEKYIQKDRNPEQS